MFFESANQKSKVALLVVTSRDLITPKLDASNRKVIERGYIKVEEARAHQRWALSLQ